MTMARFVILLALAAGALAQDLGDDLARAGRPATSPLLSLPDGAIIQRAFDHEPGLMASVSGHDSPPLRLFLWKLLAPAERHAVARAMREAGDVPASIPGLLSGPDQYRYDRAYVFAPEAREAVRAATGLPAGSFDADGRIVPSAAVIAKQDALARALFEHFRARGQDPFAGQPAPFTVFAAAPATANDRRIEEVRERSIGSFPLVLDAEARRRLAAAEPDGVAMERLAARERTRAHAAGREPAPLPDLAEARRRLRWAKSVLEEKKLASAAGVTGLSPLTAGPFGDAETREALDALHRYALDGEPLLPGATFPRTTNAVRLLFGHKNAELMQIYAEVEKMMDGATKAIWVDLFYLGGSMQETPGRDNMGVRLLRYLEKRKAAGIDVRLILSPRDTGFTQEATYKHAVDKLGARAFDLAALPGALPPRVNHDKLIVIDHGRAAMVGTMNFDANGEGHGGHHETVALVRGPAAAILAWSHQVNWRLAGGADASGDDEAVRAAMAAEPGALASDETSAAVWVTLSHPAVQNTIERLLDWIAATPKGEELRVWMFQFGDREVVAALAAAVKRGVKLRLLSDPYSGPVPQTSFLPNLAGYGPILDAIAGGTTGSAIHLLDRALWDTYMHSKVGVFGRDRFTMGSTNWTHVGIRRNAEIALFVESAPLAQKLIDRFEADLKTEKDGKPLFPTLEAFKASHPGYGNVDRSFLDRVARMMDEFF
jgi:phosphatidylserine/phosphatidylglycerophosphate/cardiolipin synthase-like enzyme